MKKVLSIVLAIAMIASMSVVAFAYNVTDANEATINVQGIYDPTTTPADVYKVDLDWNELSFTYKDAITETWDPVNHVWVPSAEGQWLATEGNVVVNIENHSSKGVKVAAKYDDNAEDAAVTSAEPVEATVNAAPVNTENAENSKGTEASLTVAVKVEEGKIAANGVLGTITVTISAVGV